MTFLTSFQDVWILTIHVHIFRDRQLFSNCYLFLVELSQSGVWGSLNEGLLVTFYPEHSIIWTFNLSSKAKSKSPAFWSKSAYCQKIFGRSSWVRFCICLVCRNFSCQTFFLLIFQFFSGFQVVDLIWNSCWGWNPLTSMQKANNSHEEACFLNAIFHVFGVQM